MTCPLCGHGQLREGTTTFAADVDGVVVVIREVPANVCDECGESYLDERVSHGIEQTVQAARREGLEAVVSHFEPVAS